MKTRLFGAVLAVLFVSLSACSSPATPNPAMVILSPKPNTQLKIGETITIQWQCVGCEHIKGDRAVVRLNANGGNAGSFNRLGEITTGFLTDSRSWTVGRYSALYGPDPRPGFYYIEVSSYPAPNDTNWTEATSGFDGVLVELVR